MTKAKNTFFSGFAVLALLGSTVYSAAAEPAQAKRAVGQVQTANAATLPNAVVVAEKYHPTANLSYKVAGKRYYPTKNVENFSQTGRASWYGPGFHGRKTSNGERFDMNMMTAAHPTLPIPSYARVTNLANGKSVVVRINDRGPFHGNRAIDLSKAAASKLGFLSKGTAQVRIEALKAGDSMADKAAEPALQKADASSAGSSGKRIFVSLKTFEKEADAQDFMRQTARYLDKAKAEQRAIIVKGRNGYMVRVGPFTEQKHADETQNRLQQQHQDVI